MLHEVFAPDTNYQLSATELLAAQRAYFNKGATLSINFRIEQLRKLRHLIADNEKAISDALHKDLHKSEFEAYGTEIGFVLGEIDHTLSNLRNWARPQKVSTPLFHAIGSSYLYSDPYGVTLIIAPWNYPFQLCIAPLIGAIAAGNTVVLKPSEVAAHTSALIEKMINDNFEPAYIKVANGNVEVSKALLEQRWDYIFFTGGTEIGRYVYQCAAKHLTPVTLELGGKSPCVVDENINLDVTSRRIVWGKFTNAGQTCVAPDYLLVNRAIKDKLLDKMKTHITEFFGVDPQQSPDFGRIIADRHVDRLARLLKSGEIYTGGKVDRADRYISPTILTAVSTEDAVMQEEIFGPILPVIEYNTIEEAIAFIKRFEKPLAMYVFTENSVFAEQMFRHTSAGGGCVNDTLMHLGNVNLPFGGVGESGIGAYHGKFSFDVFSHKKSIHKKSTISDLKIRYAPYKGNLPTLKKLMKWLN
jgi:aldehyde dehydrogenase (NAD+)